MCVGVGIAGCTKSLDANPSCMAVDYYIAWCDSSWNVVEKHVTLHYDSVCGDELNRLKADSAKHYATCPSNNITWLEITPIKTVK